MKVTGHTLKWIALITMIIDHFGAIIIEKLVYRTPVGIYTFLDENREFLDLFYRCLRGIGRISFPIYVFLLVQGFCYTRHLKNYIFRIFVFALISELPFDLAFNGMLFDLSYNNVFFTLGFGLLVLSFLKWTGEQENMPIWVQLLLDSLVIVLAFCFAEFVFRVDYGGVGVLTIVVMYLLRQTPKFAFSACVILLAATIIQVELVSLLVVPIIGVYNKERGKQMKYLFYIIYPVHIFVFYLISLAL